MTGETPLVLVSNRGPATFQDGQPTRGGGGLVTALQGLVHHRDAVWVASAMTDEDAELLRSAIVPPLFTNSAVSDSHVAVTTLRIACQ